MWPLLIAAIGCATTGEVRDRGLAPASTTSEALSRALEPRRVAVVIGVDEYADPAFPDLKHAVHDAEALSKALLGAEGGGFDRVMLMSRPTETTRDAIARALSEARETLRREDELVVYFSGHGTRLPDEERDAWRRFLLTSDARAGDLEGTALDVAELQRFFSALPPARKALILDACFHGDGKAVIRPEALPGPMVSPGEVAPRATAMGPGEAHLYATSPGRPSREDDKLGHGVYTWFLLEAMSWGFKEADSDGDKALTAWEAHDYARGRTMDYTEGVQIPEAAFRVVGEADLVLAGDPRRVEERERALIYLYDGDSRLSGASLGVDARDRGVFPGTVPLEPGRHHLVVRGADGEVLLEGTANLLPGRAYQVDDLARVIQGPSQAVGVRSVGLTSAPMSAQLGGGAVGAEAWWIERVNTGAARGLYRELGLGGGVSRLEAPRGLGWLAFTGGYQGDYRRLRYRAGWGLSAVLIPPSYEGPPPEPRPQPGERPSQEGWMFLTMGPRAGVGVVVSEAVTVGLDLRAQGAWLDLDRDGDGAMVPWLGAGLGVELSR